MGPLELLENAPLATSPVAIELQCTVLAGRPPPHLPGGGKGEWVGALLLGAGQGWEVKLFRFLTTGGGASRYRLLKPIVAGGVDGLVELQTSKGRINM